MPRMSDTQYITLPHWPAFGSVIDQWNSIREHLHGVRRGLPISSVTGSSFESTDTPEMFLFVHRGAEHIIAERPKRMRNGALFYATDINELYVWVD